MPHGVFAAVGLDGTHHTSQGLRWQVELLKKLGLPTHAEVRVVAHDEFNPVARRQKDKAIQSQLHFPIGQHGRLIFWGHVQQAYILDGGVLEVQRQDLKVFSSHVGGSVVQSSCTEPENLSRRGHEGRFAHWVRIRETGFSTNS